MNRYSVSVCEYEFGSNSLAAAPDIIGSAGFLTPVVDMM